ncbi:hypothetical protein BC828DRAFT_385938, partial [Blastocladiella britannica]
MVELLDEVWGLVIEYVAADHASLGQCLLVNKLFYRLVKDERTARSAFLYLNARKVVNAHGRAPKLREFTRSWWALYLDQRWFERIWLHASPDDLEYVAIEHTLASTVPGTHLALRSYDWVVADIGVPRNHHGADPLTEPETGVIAAMSNHDVQEGDPDFLVPAGSLHAVHLVSYPSLQPVATHILWHECLGASETFCDLPWSGTGGERLNEGDWAIKLLCVCPEQSTYAISVSEETGNAYLALRRYDIGETGTGVTIATFGTVLDLFTDELYSRPDGTFVYIYNTPEPRCKVVIHRLSAMLEPLNRIELPVYCEIFEYHPLASPDVIFVTSPGGLVTLWNVHTGTPLESLQATDGVHCETIIPKPWYRPGLFESLPPVRPTRGGAPDIPLHQQRDWMHLVVGSLACAPGQEDNEERAMHDCQVIVRTLPPIPEPVPTEIGPRTPSPPNPAHPITIVTESPGPTLASALLPPSLSSTCAYQTSIVAGASGNLILLDPRTKPRALWRMTPVMAAWAGRRSVRMRTSPLRRPVAGSPVPVAAARTALVVLRGNGMRAAQRLLSAVSVEPKSVRRARTNASQVVVVVSDDDDDGHVTTTTTTTTSTMTATATTTTTTTTHHNMDDNAGWETESEPDQDHDGNGDGWETLSSEHEADPADAMSISSGDGDGGWLTDDDDNQDHGPNAGSSSSDEDDDDDDDGWGDGGVRNDSVDVMFLGLRCEAMLAYRGPMLGIIRMRTDIRQV